MKNRITLAVAAGLALVAGAAIAQAPPPAPPPQDAARPAPPPPPPRGLDARPGEPMGYRGEPGGPGHGPHMRGPMPMPFASKGAFLRVDRNGGVTLKCADDDSTRACLEAAGPLLEKLVQPRP